MQKCCRLVTALAGTVIISLSCSAHADPPNILLIYADDVGYGDLSSYGQDHIPTPELDELAEEGVRFTDAYATAATCTPSRYSLMTGEYAFREGAVVASPDTPLLIDSEQLTLASMLRDAGYVTGIVGKWHLGLGDETERIDWEGQIAPGPLEVGFDESFIIPSTNDRVPTVYVEGHEVVGLSDEDDPLRISMEGPIGDVPTGHSHPEQLRYPADDQHSGTIVANISRIGFQAGGQSAWWDDEQMAFDLTERAVQFLEDHQHESFFLFLSMHENHVPRAPHPDFVGQSEVGLRGDAVVELDWVVGQMKQSLEELGLRENTLIIFTSDNGPVLFDGYRDGVLDDVGDHRPSGPFRGGKYLPFEGGTRMPTIVNWPDGVEPGKVSDAMISQVDFLASLAALIDYELPEHAGPDSKNVLPALLGQTNVGRSQLVQHPAGPPNLALRRGAWKYIEPGRRTGMINRHNMGGAPLGRIELSQQAYLFNLDEDPGEQTNIIDEHPEIAEQMRQRLEWVKEHPEALPR